MESPRVRLEGSCKSGEAASGLSKLPRTLTDQAMTEMEAEAEFLPDAPAFERVFAHLVQLLKKVNVVAEEKRAILRLDLPDLSLREILAGTGTETSAGR